MTLPLIKLVAVTYNDMVCQLMYGKCMTLPSVQLVAMSYIDVVCQLIQWKMYDIIIRSISGSVIHLYGMSTDTMENV